MGKRERYYFTTEKEAEEKRDALTKTIFREGAEGVQFGAVARAEYAAVSQILEPYGVSLIEAAQYYAKMHQEKQSRKEWKAAVFELIESLERANRRETTIYNIKMNLERFREYSEAETLADFNRESVAAFLDSKQFSPATIASYRASLSNLGNFAVRREWMPSNPVADIQTPTLDRGNPTVYTIEEANRLLTEAAKLQSGRIVRRLSLLLLCGMRPTEIDQLQPDDFRKDGLRIGAGKIRGRRAVRFLPFSPCFLAWWDNYPGEIKPSNFRKIYELAKSNAGITKTGTKIERHTWISARLAVSQDENRTAREAGNSPQVIYNDYFQLIDEGEAAKLGAYCTLDSPESDSTK